MKLHGQRAGSFAIWRKRSRKVTARGAVRWSVGSIDSPRQRTLYSRTLEYSMVLCPVLSMGLTISRSSLATSSYTLRT